jgi:succinate dehydrogenase / fumarate reductase, cytochrome b subunit
MIRLVRLFSTSIGDKIVVALSGAALLGFLLGHMLGNMTVFQGPDMLNAYAAWLQGHPLVWLFRVGLITVFALHVLITIRLTRANRRARPVRYARGVVRNMSRTSRYMVLTGLMVLAFVLYHLLHLTFGVVDPEHYQLFDAQQRHDVYAMVVLGFQSPWIAASYILAILLLGLHLAHGAASLFQTLGINHESYTTLIRYGIHLLITTIVIGYCSIPILIFTGYVTLDGG